MNVNRIEYPFRLGENRAHVNVFCIRQRRLIYGLEYTLAVLFYLFATNHVLASEQWPAEANTEAVNLTFEESEFNDTNMSGASWNPVTRSLWLANNYGRFFELVEDGSGSFELAMNDDGTEAEWYPGGDLEGICQVNYEDPCVYLLDEDGWILEYDASQHDVVSLNRSWDIRAYCPEVNGSGAEGIAFVPDEWLSRQGFRSGSGQLYTSKNGMGGLIFVGHQAGGYVHVFDLNRGNESYDYIGQFKTGRNEIAGLEFDRDAGKLYIWHNTGVNYLEVTELNSYVVGSDRRLRQIVEYTGPRSGNLEGFAMAPISEADHWCFITDDNNEGCEAIVWYRQFQPSEDTDADSLPDTWELWNFGTTIETYGTADSDLDGWVNADEYIADTDPNDNTSTIAPLHIEYASPNLKLTLEATSTARLYMIDYKSNLLGETWKPLTNALGTGTEWTTIVPATKQLFFRTRVTLP